MASHISLYVVNDAAIYKITYVANNERRASQRCVLLDSSNHVRYKRQVWTGFLVNLFLYARVHYRTTHVMCT